MFHLKKKIFYGWWIVLATSLLIFYGLGTFHYGFSAFVNPVAKELGWSMVVISGAFSLYRLEAGLGAPLVGFLLDRTSPRKLVMSGVVLFGIGFFVLSQVKTIVPFYIAFVLISVSFAFVSGSAMGATLIGKWFVKKRSLALGLYGAAGGLGGLLVPVLSRLITIYGWRLTLIILAVGMWLIGIPLSLLIKQKPEEVGSEGADSRPATNIVNSTVVAPPAEVQVSVRSALCTSAFWLIILSFTCHQLLLSAVFIHLIPDLINLGFDPQFAALVVTFTTVVGIVGRIGFGWLGDIFSKKWLLVLVFLMQSMGIFALTRVHQATDLIPFLLLYSIGWGGGFSLRPAIVSEYYGRKNLGTIYGVIHGVSTCGGLAGPIMAGLIYDLQKSYYLAFVVLASVSFLTAIMLLFLKRPVPIEKRVGVAQQRV